MLLSWPMQNALVLWTPREVVLYKPAIAAMVKHVSGVSARRGEGR